MRTFIKLFALSLLIVVVLYTFCGMRSENQSINFLIVGFDDSPANTDVLTLVSYDSDANTVRALQIPRDTCIDYGDKKGKINGFYLSQISEGKTHDRALASLTDKVSSALGVSIDGCVSLTMDGLSDLVDFLGGIEVSENAIPSELKEYMSFVNGKTRLDGKSAANLVRYRKDYKRGDLDRLDTQKVFMKALFDAVMVHREKLSILSFIKSSKEFNFQIDRSRATFFALENAFKISDADLQMAMLPGDAKEIEGVWYYFIRKEESRALIEGYFPYRDKEFDKENIFIYKL